MSFKCHSTGDTYLGFLRESLIDLEFAHYARLAGQH